MGNPYLEKLPSDFSDDLLKSAKDLQPLGIYELAWPYPKVLQVINLLAERGLVILGGDVFRDGERGLVVTGDNWFVERRGGLPWTTYVRKAAQKAVQYIEKYRERNGDKYWYSLVFNRESGS